ncbi:MAG: PAS domain S-box protein [Dehalococcoidia bacterium]|nr:PAS domain S-box protein [Dehalococcoidia bacterium]
MRSIPGPAGALEEVVRLIELSPAPAALVSLPAWQVRAANEPLLALLGLDRAAVPGAPFPRSLMPESLVPGAAPTPRNPVAARFQSGNGAEIEVLKTCNLVTIDGEPHALVMVMQRADPPGAASFTNLDEGARALLSTLSFDAVGVVDAQGNILYASPSAETITGYPPEELRNRSLLELLHPDDRALALASMGRAFTSSDQVESGIFRFRHALGEWRYCETAGKAVHDDAAGTVLVIHYRDVTESVRNRAEMEALTERFSRIFELSPLATALIRDSDGILTEANAAFLALCGCERDEVVAKLTTEAFWPIEEERRAIGQAIRAEGQVHDFPLRFRSRTGREYDTLNFAETMLVNGETCVLGIAVDVTDRNALEQRLLQVEKLDAIARLAAGVAHDFNNVLGVIKLEAGVLGRNSSLDAEAREGLAEIVTATDRAARMTRQLLAFGRSQAVVQARIDLREAIAELSSILRPLLGHAVRVDLDLSQGLWPIRADSAQLDQVLVNLALNARDAMQGKGVVTIRGRNETFANDCLVPRPGDYVVLTITDTGSGMDELTRTRIFEPFFTTKAPGKGTGLGLATVHGIVVQHGGTITVESEPGAGATFTICWPRFDAAAPLPLAPHP